MTITQSIRCFGVILLGLLFAAPPARAQEIAGSFDQLRVLVKSGDTITITDSTGTEIKGKVAELSPTSLALLVEKHTRTLSSDDIASIRQRRSDSIANGAKWGFGVGAVLGVVYGLALDSAYEEDTHGALPVTAGLIYGGIFAGIGAGLDALHETERVIYAKPRTTARRIAIAPMVGRRTGAAVRVTF